MVGTTSTAHSKLDEVSEIAEQSRLAKTRTFIDSGVLIAAATGTDDVASRAMTVLDDPDRLFVTSDFVRLEVLPKARFYKNADEAQFYETFFESAEETVPASRELVANA